jgi:hypothetical protein
MQFFGFAVEDIDVADERQFRGRLLRSLCETRYTGDDSH